MKEYADGKQASIFSRAIRFWRLKGN